MKCRIWDLEQMALLREFTGHTGSLRTVQSIDANQSKEIKITSN